MNIARAFIKKAASGTAASAGLLVAVLAMMPGCNDRDSGDGGEKRAGNTGRHAPEPASTQGRAGTHGDQDHDHGHAPGEAEPAHAGHDHDHDHEHDHGHGEESHADEVTLTGEALERYGILIGTARKIELRPTFVAPARVGFNADAMAHVGSPLRGRAAEIRVGLGDTVNRGDTLLMVESPELGQTQAEYFQKRIAAQSASPATELARVAWERAKGLYEQSQGISLTEVQKREAEYKAAAAAQRGAEAAVIGAENQLHLLGMTQDAIEELARTGEISPRYSVTAPIDGRVVAREVTQGELVGPDRSADPLMVLADTRTLWVLADVPEAHLHELAKGARGWVTVRTGGAGGGAKRFEGRVSYVAPMVDAATRTAQVRIEVEAETLEGALRPGMFAQVEIESTDPTLPEPVSAIAVPDEAVQTVEGGPAVFVPVEGEPGTFAKRAVTVGRAVGGLVPILSGLEEGDEYVASGTFILKAELGKGSAAHEH